jgi:hypothetical protein
MVPLILLTGVMVALILVGFVALLAVFFDPYRPSRLGEQLLLWGIGLVLAGGVGVVVVAVMST